MTQEELKNVFKYIVKKCDMLINNSDYEADAYTQDTVEDIAELCNRILDGDYGKLVEAKNVDLEKEIQAFAKMDLYPIELEDTNESILITKHQIYKCARHFFNLGLKTKYECIKGVPLNSWQIPCADPNYPCENPQMDCINCPRFGHPQGTITMTSSMDKKESEQLVGKATFQTDSWSEIKEE